MPGGIPTARRAFYVGSVGLITLYLSLVFLSRRKFKNTIFTYRNISLLFYLTTISFALWLLEPCIISTKYNPFADEYPCLSFPFHTSS